MSNTSAWLSQFLHANLVALAAVIGGPYIAVRRHWDQENGKQKETFETADESPKKAIIDSKHEAQVVGRSVADILRGDSRELEKLRDAVK